MSDPHEFESASDPLYHAVQLPYEAELDILGIPVRFSSNSRFALDAIHAWFGLWQALDASLRTPQAPVRVKVVVQEGEEAQATGVAIRYRLPDSDRLIMHTAGSVAVADVPRGIAVAYVTPALLADVRHFSYGMLEPLTLVPVTRRDRHPVHAAVIVKDGLALVLAGEAGTGKSTVAYASSRRGWRVLSDDVAYVQLEPSFRLWGVPGRIHLPPESCVRYPELSSAQPERLANGKVKATVSMPSARGMWPPVVTRAAVCLLERPGRAPSVERVAPEQAVTFLTDGLRVQAVLYRESMLPALGHLSAGGAFRVSLSDDPEEAIPLLAQIHAAVSRNDGPSRP